MTTQKKSIMPSLIGLVTVNLNLSCMEAEAYSYRTCDSGSDKITWSETCNGCAAMRISTTSMPPGGSFDTAVRSAMASWNAVERSRFNFLVGLDTDGTHDSSNGVNEVYFDGIDGPGGTLAITRSRINQCLPFDDADIHEADVEFDTAERWDTTTFSYASSNIHFGLVATHEFGHALGLFGHEDRWLARMNSFYPDGGPITRGRLVIPIADDRAGVRFLYPESGPARADLVASNYKRTGSGTSGLVSSPSSASRGSSVTSEFTFMNIGSANSGSFNIAFHLSSNELITVSDSLLGTNSGASVNAGGVVSFSRTLTIPNNVAPGTYFLGILLDHDGRVVEWSDSNNDLAQPRTITIN